MKQIDAAMNRLAASDYGLVARGSVLAAGGTDDMISSRLVMGRWSEIHPGVYLVGVTPLSWHGRLRAATLAAGPAAMVSHKAALVLWGMDGISSAPPELTVPVTCGPTPTGVRVHRTRRPVSSAVVKGIPVSPPERTILDLAACLPAVVVEQAFDSAVRRRLTTPEKMAQCLSEQPRRGVRGVGVVARMIEWRSPGRPAGSPPESFLINRLIKAGIEEPVRQFVIRLPGDSVAVVDLAWPRFRKAVEIDGLEAHGSAQALEQDLERQNLLLDVNWDLRRFSARQIFRNPDHVVASIRRFLAE